MDGTLARLSTYVSNGYENPLKKTTVTMYVNPARRDDMATTTRRPATDGFDPRLQDGRAFSLGPGPKVIGGQLMSAYDDRPTSGPRMGTTKDFADILRDFKSQRTPPSASASASATAAAPGDDGAAPTTAFAQRGRRAGGPMAQRKGQHTGQVAEHAQHASQAAAAGPSPGGGAQQQSVWQSRRLLSSMDLPPGPTLGARETMGAPNMHIIASKHVFIPPQVQLSGDASGSSAGLPTSQGLGPWGRHTLGTLNEYAANKALGHSEYERACKGLDGAGSWQRTLQDLHSSMHVARPSRLQSPTEHMAGTLHALNTLRSEGLVR